MSKSRSKPVEIVGIMESLVRSLGLQRNYYGWLVVSQWPEIVGEHYARNSRAFRFDDGVLHVAVENPIWRQRMAMDTEEILRLIHTYPHGRVIKNLRLVRGEKGTPINAD